VTWKELWGNYEAKAIQHTRRVMEYSRWLQYVHSKFPGVNMSRTKRDLCDACVRIETALSDINLSAASLKELETEKQLHSDAAINQRRTMSDFARQYVSAIAPQQAVSAEIIPDHSDMPLTMIPPIHRSVPLMLIQIEDFGGSFPLPVYISRIPSADYFNSNLMIHNFVVADLTNGINTVLLYDELAQGKGADAMCSLRLLNHLNQRKHFQQVGQDNPKRTLTLLQVLDNCVMQNKSRVVFVFYAMLSIVFYKKVVLLFLLPGHSLNAADRVVPWCRGKMKHQNLYVPEEIATKMNEIDSVRAELLDHRKRDRPFFCGWEDLLSKYFKRMPDKYTGNYFFEIDSGVVSMRHLVSTEDSEIETFFMIGNGVPQLVREAFLSDLFGDKCDLDIMTMKDVRLDRHPLLELTLKKRKSLALKYFSIPREYLSYYPKLPEDNTAEGAEHGAVESGVKRKLAVGVKPKAKKAVGRPRKLQTVESNQPSILTFLQQTSRAYKLDTAGFSDSNTVGVSSSSNTTSVSSSGNTVGVSSSGNTMGSAIASSKAGIANS
jgi:hypothetical protein